MTRPSEAVTYNVLHLSDIHGRFLRVITYTHQSRWGELNTQKQFTKLLLFRLTTPAVLLSLHVFFYDN
jgi:2',3'-cyclic-nucleotide 2'-phosphodiesterase (5'-nucleotidase family)